MSKVFLSGFKAGSTRYEHTFETDSDETFIHVMDATRRLYSTNEGGWVRNSRGNIAGRFTKTDSGNYFYQSLDKSARINTKFKDRLDAERDVFSVLLAFGYRE